MYRIINGYYIGLKNGIGTSNQWFPEMAIDIISRSFFSAWLVNCKRHGRSPRGLSTINCRSVRGDSGPWDLWVFSMTYSVRKLPPSHCPQLPCGSSLDWSKKVKLMGKSMVSDELPYFMVTFHGNPLTFTRNLHISWENPGFLVSISLEPIRWEAENAVAYAWATRLGENMKRERESILCILIHQHSPTSILLLFFFLLLYIYIY